MKKYLVKVYENTYGGLHGTVDTFVNEYNNEQEVINDAINASIELMDSYSFIIEDIEEQAKECSTTEEEYDKYFENAVLENVAYEYYELNTDIPCAELDKMAYENFDEVLKYCVK